MKWVRRLGAELPVLERRYFRQVAWWLSDVPETARQSILEQVRDHLLDRPAASEPSDLTWKLGEPREYAQSIRADAGLGAERRDFWARWIALPPARRFRRVGASIVLVGAVVGGAATWAWWTGWQAKVWVTAASYQFEPPLASKVAVPPAIDPKNPFPPDREIFQYDGSHQLLLEYQLVTDRPIRVDEIRLPGAGRYAPVRVIEVDWRPSGTYIDRPVRAPPPRPKYRAWQPSVVEPRFDGIWVRLRLRFHNCEHLQSPGSISYNQLRVRYHALGRERTAMINLYRPLAITGAAPEDCARWAAGGR